MKINFKRNYQLYLGVSTSCSVNFNYCYQIAEISIGKNLFETGSFRQRLNVYKSVSSSLLQVRFACLEFISSSLI